MSILLAAAVSGALSMCSAENWDERFVKPLESIAAADQRAAAAIAKQLRHVRESFEQINDYSEARKLVGQIGGPIRSQVRIEIGSPGTTIYKVIWFLEGEDRQVVVSNLKDKLGVRELSRTQWDHIHGALVGEEAWSVASTADYGMLDGTVYFASISIKEGTGQFVIYAPVLDGEEGLQERASFAQQTKRQTRILQVLMKMAEGVHRN
jgi:hypothetical protein